VKAMRVNRFLRVNPTSVDEVLRDPMVETIVKAFKSPGFSAAAAAAAPTVVPEFETLRRGWMLEGEPQDWIRAGALSISNLAYAQGMVKLAPASKSDSDDDDLAVDSLLAEFKASRAQQNAGQIEQDKMVAPLPPPKPKVNLIKDDDEEDALDFSSLFGNVHADTAAESKTENADTTLSWKDFTPPIEHPPEINTDIVVKESLTKVTTAIPSDLSEEFLPPEQVMTPFIADIMKRTGRALGQNLFGRVSE
jgi:hypothetical protein